LQIIERKNQIVGTKKKMENEIEVLKKR